MIKYRLSKTDFIEDKDLTIVHLYNKNWMNSYLDSIELLIRYFNDEHEWDEMFNINDVKERISQGNNLFLLYYGSNAIGYVFFKEIEKNTCFGYNLYVTKLIKRPKNISEWFYNRTCSIMLKNYDNIECEIDEWNNLVKKMVENLGYREIN